MTSSSSLAWLTAIVDAVKRLSRHRIDAVLIIADSTSMVADEGVVIGAQLSAPLLVALFLPEALNELAGGAVVVRDGVVERAAVPVLRSAGGDWIGELAKESSATVVVVAEEDGAIRLGRRDGTTPIVEASALIHQLADAVRPPTGFEPDTLEPILVVLKRSFTYLRDLVTTGFEAPPARVRTGFERWDTLAGGLKEGEIVVLAGREGLGVNTLLLQIAANVARGAATPPVGVLLLSPHLTQKDMALRMMWSICGIDQREETLEPAEWRKLSESAATLSALPIWFDSSPSLTVEGLKDRIHRLRQRFGDDESCILVVIPDLALLGSHGTLWGQGRALERTTTALRTVARDLDVPVVAAVGIPRGTDHYAALAELRRLQSAVDRLATLHPGWSAENEVYVQIHGRLGNYGFRLRVTSAGTFEDAT